MSFLDRSLDPPSSPQAARLFARSSSTVLAAVALVAAVAGGGRAGAFENPSVALTSPAPDATFTAPATVVLQATASGGDGTVERVTYFDGVAQTKIGEATALPYLVTWTGVEPGAYLLVPVVTNSLGDAWYPLDGLVPIVVHPPEGPRPLDVRALRGRVPYTFGGGDGFWLKGVLHDVPAHFDPTGLRASVDVGGGVSSFRLDAAGRSENPADADGYAFVLHLKGKRDPTTGRVDFAGGDVPSELQTSFNFFQPLWQDEGIAQDVGHAELTFDVTVGLGGRTYAASVPVDYWTRSGRTGAFRSRRSR